MIADRNTDIKRCRWIDFAKFVAIIAVMTDHMRGVLYSSDKVQIITFFSVTLFVLLMGITTYWSFECSKEQLWKKVLVRILNMLLVYLVAVFVFYVVLNKSFDWNDYMDFVLSFNISLPHYYVLLYIVLVAIAPVLYFVIERIECFFNKQKIKHKCLLIIIAEIVFGGGLIAFSNLTDLYSNINDIYGGGGKLFGGSYLLVMYLGMLFGKYYKHIVTMKRVIRIILFVFSILGTISMVIILVHNGYVFDRISILGTTINPPGITLIVYALLVMISIFFIDNLVPIERIAVLDKIYHMFSWIGENTLYIFLYHLLFAKVLNYILRDYIDDIPTLIRIIILYGGMILGSILMGYLCKTLKKLLINSYTFSSKEKNDG